MINHIAQTFVVTPSGSKQTGGHWNVTLALLLVVLVVVVVGLIWLWKRVMTARKHLPTAPVSPTVSNAAAQPIFQPDSTQTEPRRITPIDVIEKPATNSPSDQPQK